MTYNRQLSSHYLLKLGAISSYNFRPPSHTQNLSRFASLHNCWMRFTIELDLIYFPSFIPWEINKTWEGNFTYFMKETNYFLCFFFGNLYSNKLRVNEQNVAQFFLWNHYILQERWITFGRDSTWGPCVVGISPFVLALQFPSFWWLLFCRPAVEVHPAACTVSSSRILLPWKWVAWLCQHLDRIPREDLRQLLVERRTWWWKVSRFDVRLRVRLFCREDFWSRDFRFSWESRLCQRLFLLFVEGWWSFQAKMRIERN